MHGHRHDMEHGDTTILLASLVVVAAQALCMNPVTSHLDAFELHDFFFFNFFFMINLETLSPFVELQKSRLDALEKKKLTRILFLKLEKKNYKLYY